MKWVDINLPWYRNLNDDPQIVELSKLNEEWRLWYQRAVVEKFGKQEELPDGIIRRMKELHAAAPELQQLDRLADEDFVRACEDKYAGNEEVIALLRYRHYSQKTSNWLNEQPETIANMERLRTIRKIQETGSFSYHELCKPRVLIEIQGTEPRYLLLGDIDTQGGTCGCCSDVSGSDIVLRACDLTDSVNAAIELGR